MPAMQELGWLLEPLLIWLNGGDWADIKAAPGFIALMLLGAILIPSSLIMVGIGGLGDLRRTPLAIWLGSSAHEPEPNWTERARDLDGDGRPDF